MIFNLMHGWLFSIGINHHRILYSIIIFKQMKIKQDREGKSFQATDQHVELVVLEGPDADKQIGGNSS